MEREDDVQLVRKILSGDDAAFGILVEKYQKSVHALVWRKIGDYHYAEDIMQDAFFQAYKKLSTLKNPNQFAGWLYVIANRLCIDWMRKQKWMQEQKFVMQSLEETPAEEIEKASYAGHVSAQRQTESSERCHAIVKKLLEKLPESERTVVMLYYLDEMSTKEIGKFLGVSVNTIASRLHRARKRLQVDQELLIQEVLDDGQLSENLKENIMSQLANIRSKFDSFMAQAKSDPTSGEDILTEAHDQVEDALKGEITPELAHLADEIYEYIGSVGMEKRVSLHRRYLNVASDNKERFWSHRQLSGNLARLQRNKEAIEEQVRLYRWTCEHLSDEDVLETVNSLSHTGCWKAEGRVDEWFQLYDEASERLDNPELSRYAYDAHTHFFLAVSVWAAEKDREKTLHHLKATQDYVLNPNRDMYYSNFLETPEFSDVKDDEAFLKALGQK